MTDCSRGLSGKRFQTTRTNGPWLIKIIKMSFILVVCVPALIQSTATWSDDSGLSLLQNEVRKLSRLDKAPNSCREPTDCELNLRNVTENTLRAGGRGLIRNSSVCAGIDLVLTASSTYDPKRLQVNGVFGYMGILNMCIDGNMLNSDSDSTSLAR